MSENVVNQPAAGVAAAAAFPSSPTLKPASETGTTTLAILVSLSVCHLLNDMNQSLVPALYPILKDSYSLDFGQIGLITLAFQLTASLLQPVVGMVTDKRPQPFSLPVAMGSSLARPAAAVGRPQLRDDPLSPRRWSASARRSSIRSRRASRGWRPAGAYGFAQSLFQLGGATGSSIGPLLAAFIVVPRGQGSIAWFSGAALLAILILTNVSLWYSRHPAMAARRGRRAAPVATHLIAAAIDGDLRVFNPVGPAVLEERLHVEPEFVLHLLPDPEIRRVGAERAASSVRLPGRRRGRDLHRRPDRRPYRAQAGDLVLDPGRFPVRADAALRQPDVDRRAERD